MAKLLFIIFSPDVFLWRLHGVFAIEAAFADGQTVHHLLQTIYLQIAQTVGANDPADVLYASVICDQLLPLRNICSKIAGPQKWRRADPHMHFLRAGLPQHPYDPVTGGAPHNGVINHNNTLSGHRILQHIQLYLYA